MLRSSHRAGFAVVFTAAAFLVPAAQRRDKRYEEPKSQVLPLPRELPMVISAETSGLSFYSSPLLKTGGLSAQIHRTLSDLLRDMHGRTVIKVRAFVSGVGDARRVQSELSDLFSKSKQPLPVLTILQVGGLGEEFAQVALEAVISSPQDMNPNGLVFFPGFPATDLNAAISALRNGATEASVTADDMLSCTCFATHLTSDSPARAALQQIFPRAAITLVQAQRDPLVRRDMCQGVARLNSKATDQSITMLSHVPATVVRSRSLVFTGLQLSFGSYLDDAREAYLRLQRAASAVQAGESPVEVNAFSLDLTAGAAIRKTTSVPSSTFINQTVEGLPSVDAAAGIEAVLAPGGPATF